MVTSDFPMLVVQERLLDVEPWNEKLIPAVL